jgi:hypothetical protein
MNWDEYNKLFHKLELNLVAFKPLMECDKEVLKLVNAAIQEERKACAQIAHNTYEGFGVDAQGVDFVKQQIIRQIKARGQSEVS